jgi:O-glycosyl hydrolase
MYGQFMRFIPRDAVRIDSSPPDGRVGTVAFARPDGRLVLVAANNHTAARPIVVRAHDGTFVDRLPPRSVSTYLIQPQRAANR